MIPTTKTIVAGWWFWLPCFFVLLCVHCDGSTTKDNNNDGRSMFLPDPVQDVLFRRSSENSSNIRILTSNRRENIGSTSRPSPMIHHHHVSSSSSSSSRALQEEDEFRKLFQRLMFLLPDISVRQDALFFDIVLTIQNLQCYDFTFGTFSFSSGTGTTTHTQDVTMTLNVQEIHFVCDMDFEWSTGFLSDTGHVRLENTPQNTNFHMDVRFQSPDFTRYPPQQVTSDNCLTNIGIDDVAFTGSFTSSVLELFDSLLDPLIENRISDMACTELNSLGTNFLEKTLLNNITQLLQPYIDGMQTNGGIQYYQTMDPLSLEKQLLLQQHTNIMNLHNDHELGKMVYEMIQQMNLYFSSVIEVVDNDGTVNQDLGLNVFLRDSLLTKHETTNDKYSFRFNVTELTSLIPFFDNGNVLFQGHDEISETTILLDSIRIFGLDTFQSYAMEDIGNYTYSLDFAMEQVVLEMDMIIDVKSSSIAKDEGSNIGIISSNGNPVEIYETFQIQIGFEDIRVTAATFVAIQESAFRKLQLGPLIWNANTIVSCLIASLYEFGISNLHVSIQNMMEPKVLGLLSPQLDNIVTEFFKAIFLLYEDIILYYMPIIFQTTVKDMINNSVKQRMSDPSSSSCSDVPVTDAYIDFRDFFLLPAKAIEYGGRGNQKYGTVVPMIHDFMTQLVSQTVLSSNQLQMNSMMIQPLTKAQSGVEGMLQFLEKDTVFSFPMDSLSSIHYSNLRLYNLDTLVVPFDILQPIPEQSYSLLNRMNFHGGDSRMQELRPLKATIKMSLNILEDEANDSKKNEMDISISTTSFELLANMFARMSSSSVLQFPVTDILNINCWLATMNNYDFLSGLSLNEFYTSFSSLAMNFDCNNDNNNNSNNCNSNVLSDLTRILQESQTIQTIGNRLNTVVEDILPILLDRFLMESPALCPHHPNYNATMDSSKTAMSSFASLLVASGDGLQQEVVSSLLSTETSETIDTAILTMATILQIGLVLLTAAATEGDTNPQYTTDYDVAAMDEIIKTQMDEFLQKQNEFDPLKANIGQILDFTNVNNSFPSLVSPIFDMTRNYLNLNNDKNGRKMKRELVDGESTASTTTTSSSSSLTNDSGIGGDGGINSLMNEFIGPDGLLELPLGGDGFQYEVAGIILQITSLKIGGLNTFTYLNIFDTIGPQTLLNSFHLQRLSFHVNLTIDSTVTTDDSFQRQQYSLSFGMNDIGVILPMFIAVDMDKFNTIELGSLLRIDEIIPCVVSSFYEGEILHPITITVGDINAPEIRGLREDTEILLTGLTTAIFDRFNDEIIHGFTSMLHDSFLPYFNSQMANFTANSQCKNILVSDTNNYNPVTDTYIDVRDFFLQPAKAIEYGGQGNQKYGTVVPMIHDILTQFLSRTDTSSNQLQINSMMIQPMTKSQSGVEGMLQFLENESLFSFPFDTLSSIDFSNLRLYNLDTLVAPLDILQPIREQSYSLLNRINFHGGNSSIEPQQLRPLTATIKMSLNIFENENNKKNEVDISIATTSFELLADIFARMNSFSVFSFPVKDILNMNCWFATMYNDDLLLKEFVAEQERMVNNNNNISSRIGLSFNVFYTAFSSLAMNFNCNNDNNNNNNNNNCNSNVLSDLTKILDESRIIQTIGNRLSTVVEQIAPIMLNRLLLESPTLCPHHPKYNASLGSSKTAISSVTSLFSTGGGELQQEVISSFLSIEPIDTAILTTATIFQIGLVLLTTAATGVDTTSSPQYNTGYDVAVMDEVIKSQMDLFLEKQNNFDPQKGNLGQILDFTNLNDNFPPYVSYTFQMIRTYLNPNKNISVRKTRREIVDEVSSTSTTTSSSSIFTNDDMSSVIGEDGGINSLINEFIGSDGLLELPLDGNGFQYEVAGIILQITSIKIGGLNTFTYLNIFDTIGPHTLLNSFHLQRLSFQIDLTIDSTFPADDSFQKQQYSLSLGMDDISVILPMFVAIDMDKFNTIELGSLLRVEEILPCVLSSFHEIEILQPITITIGDINAPEIRGLREDAEILLTGLTTAIFDRFNDAIVNGFTSIVHDSVRPFMNRQLANFIAESQCDNILDNDNTMANRNSDNNDNGNLLARTYIDFRDLFLSKEKAVEYGGSGNSPYGNVFNTIYEFVQGLLFRIDPNTGMPAMNNMLIRPFTLSQSGTFGSLAFPGDVLDQNLRIDIGEFDADLSIKVSDINIYNVDHIGEPFSLLELIYGEPDKLNNTVTAGVGGVPLRLSVRLFVELIEEDGIQFSNDLEVSLDFHDAMVMLTTLIKVAEERFATFLMGSIFNVDCWLATIPAPALDSRGVRKTGLDRSAGIADFVSSVAKMNLQLRCVSCSSPVFDEWVEIVNNSPEAEADLTALTNQLLTSFTGVAEGDFLQMQIDRRLNDAAKKCPHSPDYEAFPIQANYSPFQSESEDDSFSTILALLITAVCVGVIGSILILFVWWIVRQRHKKWLRTLPVQRLQVLMHRQNMEIQLESELNSSTKSMFQSSEIPGYVRYSMPIIILGNIAFFLSGHLSLGATVNIEGAIAGQPLQVSNFFEFSMAKSTVDIYMAGGKALAVLILIFSGIWPYSKQLITLSLWFLQPSTVSISKRGSILLWLDFLAKWSMVDIFVLVVSIVGFRLSVVNPKRDFLPDNLYEINLMVVPMWGLYANMTAQLISQVSSHFIIHYHRQIVNNATKEYNKRHNLTARSTVGDSVEVSDGSSMSPATAYAMHAEDEEEKLCQHTFSRPHRGESDKLVIRPYVNNLLRLAGLSLSILLLLGCIFPSFSLEQFGIVGLLVEAGQDFRESITSHSIFTIMKLMMDQARFLDSSGHYLGLGTLSALLILTVLFVPLMQTSVLLYQWFSPMGRKKRTKLSILNEILQAWQYTEVYVCSVICAGWQLGPISDFLVNPYCGDLDSTLSMLAYFGLVDGNDAQCFKVQASIKTSTYLIIASAGVLVFLNMFVMKATMQYLRDKDDNAFNSSIADAMSSTKLISEEEQLSSIQEIDRVRPVPVLFSDTFRWLLTCDEAMLDVQYVKTGETYEMEGNSRDEQDQVDKHDAAY